MPCAACCAVGAPIPTSDASFTHGVVRRTREIGVRMALGATRRDIARLMLRRAVRLIAIGLLASGIPARRAARVDPLTALHYE